MWCIGCFSLFFGFDVLILHKAKFTNLPQRTVMTKYTPKSYWTSDILIFKTCSLEGLECLMIVFGVRQHSNTEGK